VEYIASIREVADELLNVYHNLNDKCHVWGIDEFVQMTLMDGCFFYCSLERKSKFRPQEHVPPCTSSSPVAAAARSPDPGPGPVRTVGFFFLFNLFSQASKATACVNLH